MSESLTEVFRQTVTNFGGRPAVVGPNETLSYSDLNSRSDAIAAILRKRVARGARVGIFRRKDVDTIASIYGALKADCTYIPIDPRMGAGKLAAVLNDAGLAALIVEPALLFKIKELVAEGVVPWLVDSDTQGNILVFSGAGDDPAPNDGALAVDTPAYILYTSGSTGRPKGVQHTHSSALAFVSWAAAQFDISSVDRLTCHAPLHFDLTIFDLFVAAMTGAAVVLIPDEIAMFPLTLTSLIESERISVWYSVPFALIQMLKHGKLAGRRLAALREVIFAGERFPPVHLRQLGAALTHGRLTNLFGPTETNVCTYHQLTAEDLASDEFCPIGKPCPYASIAVLDELGNKVPSGEVGELNVGGLSVMTGYLNRPKLNEKVFVTRTLTDGVSERLFRTGDLVTAPDDGPMRFHGRADRQVKVRGFRIELDEIEAALTSCAGVVAAAAWVDSDSNGFAEVRAAVATEALKTGMTPDALILQVREHLSQAAVPARVAVLSDLPRTANGKLDYLALARLE
jgi:amino acid adenylation domain-containing protein